MCFSEKREKKKKTGKPSVWIERVGRTNLPGPSLQQRAKGPPALSTQAGSRQPAAASARARARDRPLCQQRRRWFRHLRGFALDLHC